MDFNEWFEEVLMYANQSGVYDLIARAPFMYEDYYNSGMTPHEAFEAEWGN